MKIYAEERRAELKNGQEADLKESLMEKRKDLENVLEIQLQCEVPAMRAEIERELRAEWRK